MRRRLSRSGRRRAERKWGRRQVRAAAGGAEGGTAPGSGGGWRCWAEWKWGRRQVRADCATSVTSASCLHLHRDAKPHRCDIEVVRAASMWHRCGGTRPRPGQSRHRSGDGGAGGALVVHWAPRRCARSLGAGRVGHRDDGLLRAVPWPAAGAAGRSTRVAPGVAGAVRQGRTSRMNDSACHAGPDERHLIRNARYRRHSGC